MLGGAICDASASARNWPSEKDRGRQMDASPVQQISGLAGPQRAGRPAAGRFPREGAAQPEHARGECGGQERGCAGEAGGEARESHAEGLGCGMDREERGDPLRLREPCRCGPEVQAGARFHAADASARGSQAVHRLPGHGSSSAEARADSACGPEAIDEKSREAGLASRIHRKGRRGKPPGGRCRQGSRTGSKARTRAGHVFGARANGMGGALARAVGMTRAKAKIGMMSLACNMRRSCCLGRTASLPLPA